MTSYFIDDSAASEISAYGKLFHNGRPNRKRLDAKIPGRN